MGTTRRYLHISALIPDHSDEDYEREEQELWEDLKERVRNIAIEPKYHPLVVDVDF